jgi:hypothetical protein
MLQAMANDAKHLALPLTHAVIVSFKKVNGFPNGSCDILMAHSMFLCFFFLPCFASFLHPIGND